MKRNSDEAKDRIVHAGRRVLQRRGAFRFTVDLVATEARCAKGLVHYHFGTKTGLLRELLSRAAKERALRWQAALSVADAQEAVAATWTILTDEATECDIYGGGLVTISNQLRDLGIETHQEFARTLGEAMDGLMRRTGLRFDVPSAHVGALIAANVTGAIIRLASGVDSTSVEEAYALAWLGLLSLTVPA